MSAGMLPSAYKYLPLIGRPFTLSYPNPIILTVDRYNSDLQVTEYNRAFEPQIYIKNYPFSKDNLLVMGLKKY